MTDIPIGSGEQKLGVGEILGDAFSIMFGNFFKVLLLSLVPMIVFIGFAAVIFIPMVLNGTEPDGALFIAAIVAIVLVFLIATYFTSALTVRLAYDAKTGQPLRLGSYFASTFAVLGPLLVCTLITGIAILIGFALFIVPGLYLMAMWVCVTPAIVLEGAGLGSISRSADLTRGYRWACVGALLLMFLCLFGFGIAMNIIEAILTAIAGDIVAGLVSLLLNGVTVAFSGIFGALVYARLREIKEGTSVEQLAEVFS
jgi:hypothetical protein